MNSRTTAACVAVITRLLVSLSPGQQAANPAPSLVDRGAHFDRWAIVTLVTNAATGRVTPVHRQNFVNLGVGLNYQDELGNWQVTREEFQLTPQGYAVAQFGPHRVILSPSLLDLAAVDLLTPDNVRLLSRPIGVGYYDPVTGDNLFLGAVRDVQGELVAPNQVIFRNAIEGQNMSIRYTYRRSGWSQDLIVHAMPPSPEALGLSPLSRFEFYTEFDPATPMPQQSMRVLRKETDPVLRQTMHEPDFTDVSLDFGVFHIGNGKAFILEQAEEASAQSHVRVGKRFELIEGRPVLIEAVEWRDLSQLLGGLPPAKNANVAAFQPRRQWPALLAVRNLPAHARDENGSLLAKVRSITPKETHPLSPPGVVLDYTIQGTISGFTAQADTTYFVVGQAVLEDDTVLEGGAILKFLNSSLQQYGGTIRTETSFYTPVVFTSRNDNTIGVAATNSSGNPTTETNLNIYLQIANGTGTDLKHLRFSYAYTALAYDICTGSNLLSHAQFTHCREGVFADTANYKLGNVLMYDMGKAFTGYGYTGAVEHLTLNQCSLVAESQAGSALRFTNTLWVAVTNTGSVPLTTHAVSSNSSSFGVFYSLGGGAHYHAGDTYRDLGTTNVSPRLLAELRETSNFAPLILTNVATVSTNLGPIVPRETGTPDLGYGYPVVDYAANTFTVTNNATNTFLPGTVIAGFGPYSLWLAGGSTLRCEGTPTKRIQFVRSNALQEQTTNWGGYAPIDTLTITTYHGTNPAPQAFFRFTDFNATSGDGTHLYGLDQWSYAALSVRDCTFRSANAIFAGTAQTVVGVTNNLFERVSSSFEGEPNIAVFNNLSRGGSVSLYNQGTNKWTFKDNVFLGTSIFDDETTTNSHNAYLNLPSSYDRLFPTNSSDVVLTNFLFQPGALGAYYHLSTNLFNKGSRNVTNSALYSFTCETNQLRDSSTVDIGLHYVALTNNLPFDVDNEGLPDYAEDLDGGGTLSSGETSMTLADTDGDGRNDAQELAEGTDPLNRYNVEQVRLGYWRFNTSDWRGEDGQLPLATNNVLNVVSTNFDGYALNHSYTNGAAVLRYREIEPNGRVNVTDQYGTVMFFYRPFWTGQYTFFGTGPQQWATLFAFGRMTLDIEPTGTRLLLRSRKDDGTIITNAEVGIQFNAGIWQQIGFSYSPSATYLHLASNFRWVTNVALTNIASADSRAYGFTVGSQTNGLQSDQGMIDELETFNYSIGEAEYKRAREESLVAETSANPATIKLKWRMSPAMGDYRIERRDATGVVWTVLATNYSPLSYTDAPPNVVVGKRYEYQVGYTVGSMGSPILTGIDLPLIENRGKVLLLVDQTLTNALATNLVQLHEDLVGDGWKVLQYAVPRHNDTNWPANTNNIAVIKNLVSTNYNADPTNTKAIYVLGHVAVPYSGWMGPDGHGPRPWPADGYYGSLTESNWTDSLINTNAEVQGSHLSTNLVNDGRFDQSSFPTNQAGILLDLAVGRVDFAKMPVFYDPPSPHVARSEEELLKQYLAKTRRYRRREIVLADRTTVQKVTTDDNAAEVKAPIMGTALRNTSRLVGFEAGKILSENFFASLQRTYLFGFQNGFGSYASISDKHTYEYDASELVNPLNEPKAGFYILGASYFGDWNQFTNNLLRALLCTPNFGYAAMYCVGAQWHLQPLGIGESLGLGFHYMLNRVPGSAGYYAYLTILGDPTLRLQILTPPKDLAAVVAQGKVQLSWQPSLESGVQYVVYRSTNGIAGSFNRLTSAPLATSTFLDNSPPAGSKLYEVRAAKLISTGSGSFTNLSQGMFISVN